MMRSFVVLTVALLLALPAIAAPLAVTPGLVPGRVLNYEIAFALERGLALGAGRDRLVQEAGLTLTVDGIDDDGVATVHGEVEWVIIDLDRASFRVRVDSRDIQGDSPNKAETTIRELVQHYLDSTFTMRVASDGTVGELTGFDPVTEFVGAKDGTLARLAAGRLMPATLARDLEPIWRADGASGMELSVGDSWTTTRESPLMGPIVVTLETPYKVAAIEDGVLRAAGDVAVDIKLPEGIEFPISFTIEEDSGNSTLEWDAGVGALRSRVAETSYTMILETEDGKKQGSQRSARASLTLVSSEGAGG